MELQPACTLTLDALAALFNRAFANYVGGDVHFDAPTLARFLARDNVDLDLSQVILVDGQPVGFGYVARQGWSCRLAAFGVVLEATGVGVGKAAMLRLIEQAKQRGDRAFELEVIEQNPRALRLYEAVGFQRIRRLVGYEAKSPAGESAPGLETLDVYDVAKIVVQHGAPDLPWVVAGATIARHAPPNVANRLDHAYAVISNPDAATIALRSLIVPTEYRRQGRATRLMRALFACHPDKRWSLPAIFPAESGSELLAKLGFTRLALSQWQMRLEL